jgi:hypothetical protein
VGAPNVRTGLAVIPAEGKKQPSCCVSSLMSDQGSPSLGPAARQVPPPAALPVRANAKPAASKPVSKPAARNGAAPSSTSAGKQQVASKPKHAAPSPGDTFATSLGKAPGTCLGHVIDSQVATDSIDAVQAKNARDLTKNLLFSPTHSSYLNNASISKATGWSTLHAFETNEASSGEWIILPYAARDSTKNARPVVPAIQVTSEGAMHLVYFVYGDSAKPKHKVVEYGFDQLHGTALSGNIKLVDASPCANDAQGYEHFDYQMRYILHMLSSSRFVDDRRDSPALYNRVRVYSHEKDFKPLMELAIKITEAEDSLPRWLPVKLVVLDNLDSLPKANLKGHPMSLGTMSLGAAFFPLAAALPRKHEQCDLLLEWLALSPSATLERLKAALPKPAPAWFSELSSRAPAQPGEKRGTGAVNEGESGSAKRQKAGDAGQEESCSGGEEREEQEEREEREEQAAASATRKRKKADDDEESELSSEGSDEGSAASSDDDESEEEDSEEESEDSDDDDSDDEDDHPKKKQVRARKAAAKPSSSSSAAKTTTATKKAANPPDPPEPATAAAEHWELAQADTSPAVTEAADASAVGDGTAAQKAPRRPAAEGDGRPEAQPPALRRRKPICLQITAAVRMMEPSLSKADPTHQMSSKIEKIKDALKIYEETGKVHATESLLTLTGSLMLTQAKVIKGLLEQNDRAASKAAIRKMETAMDTLGDETPTLQELSDVLNKWATKTTEMMAARVRCTRELDRATLELSSVSTSADAGAASSSSTQGSGSQ